MFCIEFYHESLNVPALEDLIPLAFRGICCQMYNHYVPHPTTHTQNILCYKNIYNLKCKEMIK